MSNFRSKLGEKGSSAPSSVVCYDICYTGGAGIRRDEAMEAARDAVFGQAVFLPEKVENTRLYMGSGVSATVFLVFTGGVITKRLI